MNRHDSNGVLIESKALEALKKTRLRAVDCVLGDCWLLCKAIDAAIDNKSRFSIPQLGKDDLASLLVLTSKLSSGVGTSEKGRSQVAVALDWNSTCSSLLADVLFSACPL